MAKIDRSFKMGSKKFAVDGTLCSAIRYQEKI